MTGTDQNVIRLKAFFVQQTLYDHAPHAAVTDETRFCVHVSQTIPDPWCHDQVNTHHGFSVTQMFHIHTS
ncbi:MAG: hypothetical protein Q7U51_06815, partial [Methanoregula sp.]|nr:hypothetical protein [Methanoregula sp.]